MDGVITSHLDALSNCPAAGSGGLGFGGVDHGGGEDQIGGRPGLLPDEEIPIVFTGLRPGEKLSEELVGTDETVVPSGVDKIFQVQAGWLPEPEGLAHQLTLLERLAVQGQAQAVLDFLQEAVPTFCPQYGGPP